MKPQSGYIPVESNAPLRGLATTPTSTRLDPSYSPSLWNCTVRDGVVRRRAGYTQLGRRLVGRVMAITEFGEIGDDPWFVVLTSHRQYVYDPVSEDFLDLTPGQTSYTIVDVSATSFTIAGNHVSNFPADRLIPVIGGANENVYTVVSAVFGGVNTVITVVEPVPSLVVAGVITVADDLDTDDFAQINFAALTDTNKHQLLITNGTDVPRFWEGNTGTAFADWAPTITSIPGFVSCRTLAVFNEHLFLGGIIGSTDQPQLIAWSNAGDFEDFDTGTSGTQLLYQLDDIKELKPLGDRLAIYSEDAIMTGVFVDAPAYFAFEVVIPEGTRLVGPKSIVSINVGHVYVSEENIYLFDGTRGLRVLGDAVYSDYKLRKDFERLELLVGVNDYSKRTLYFSVPGIDTDPVVYSAEYDVFDLSRITWARETYAHAPRAFGFFTNRDVEYTWDDAPWEVDDNPWSNELGAWLEETEQLNFPIRAFGTNDGDVFLITESALTDDGTEVEQTYETMDFTIPEVFHSTFGRWGELEFEAFGDSVDVSYSLDKGASFTSLGTTTLTPSPQSYVIPYDVSSRVLRFRFQTTGYFGLRWVRTWVRIGGPR